MAVRAVLIGLVNEGRLFYLLDNTPDGKDAAFMSSPNDVQYVRLSSFVAQTPNITELHTTEFHHFLWSPQTDHDKKRWKRIFINKTQPVTKDMLVGVDIIPDLAPKKKREARKKKDALSNRALQFKMLMVTNNQIPGGYLFGNRRRGYSMRSNIGLKGIGNPITARRGFDGDGDGFVDDGLPTMRPFIPGLDIGPLDRSALRGMRSIRTSGGITSRDRALSQDSVNSFLADIETFAEIKFHGGKPITTKGDALAALAFAIPSFSHPEKKKRSTIDFLSGNPNEALKPWQKSYVHQFLLMVGTHPDRNDAMYEIKAYSDDAPMGIGGQAAPLASTDQWTFDPITKKFKPQKVYEPTKIAIKYTDPESGRGLMQFASLMLGKQNMAFNITTSTLERGIQQDMSRKGLSRALVTKIVQLEQFKGAGDKVSQRIRQGQFTDMRDIIETAQNIILIWDQLRSGPFLSSPDAREILAEQELQVDSILSFIGSVLSGQPQSPSELYATLSSIKDVADAVSKASAEEKNIPTISSGFTNLMEIRNKWAPFEASTTGIHESTHALQFIVQSRFLLELAEGKRQEFLREEIVRRGRQLGRKLLPQEISKLSDSVSAYSFLPDVLFDSLSELGQNNPDALRTKVQLWGTEALGLPFDPSDPSNYRSNSVPALLDFLESYYGSVSGEPQELDPVQRFGTQLIYIGQDPAKLSPELSRLINDVVALLEKEKPELIQASGLKKTGPGDELTINMLMALFSSDVLGRAKQNTSYRQLRILPSENGPGSPLLAFSAHGYPQIQNGGAIIEGLSPDETKLLFEAASALAPMAVRFKQTLASSPVDARQAFMVRQQPDEISLPMGFDGISYSEFKTMDPERILQIARLSFAALSAKMISYDNSKNKRFFPNIINSLRISFGEYDSLSDAQIKELERISGLVGTPTGRESDPAYSNYQSTLLAGNHTLSPGSFSLAEFSAESAVAEILGLPISQAIAGQTTTRELSNYELQLVTTLLGYLFKAGMPSDLLREVNV